MKGAKFIDVAGIRTRYFEAGQGEPLVLVHGGQFGSNANAEDWGDTIEAFAKDFHVFAIDKPGQGHTDNPKNDADYVIGATVKHLYQFLKALGIKKANLAGHSRGGYTVCRLALEHPEAVKSIVIVDSATMMWEVTWYVGVEESAPPFRNLREQVRYFEAANSFAGNHVTEDWLDGKLEIEALPSHKEAVQKMSRLDGKYIRDQAAKVEETHRWIKEGRLKCPVLVTWAYEDPSAQYDPVGLAAFRLILPNVPNAQVHVFNKAGHYVYRERPTQFVAVVKSFIQDLPK